MSQPKLLTPSPGLNIQDILYVLFKHKWKILLCAAIGIGAAASALYRSPTVYVSEAKLLVRYVADTSAIDKVDSRDLNETLMRSEEEILTSWDLAMEVAKALVAERLLPQSAGGSNISNTARGIRGGLTVSARPGTNIIVVSYKDEDPELATLVLKELLTRYFTKHLEVHRSADAFNFVSQQSDEIKARLNQTQEELDRLKQKAGITSLKENTTTLLADVANTRNAIQAAETEHAEQLAIIQELEKSASAQQKDQPKKLKSPDQSYEAVQQYHALIDRLRQLRETQLGLLSKYVQEPAQRDLLLELQRNRQIRTPTSQQQTARDRGMAFVGSERDMAQAMAREWYRRQNDTGFAYTGGKKSFDALVKEAEKEILGVKNKEVQEAKKSESQLMKLNQEQIDNLERQRSDLEKKYPGIATSLPTGLTQEELLDHAAARARRAEIFTARTRLAGIEARTEALKAHLRDIQEQSQQLSKIEPQIAELERTKEIAETNYKYFQSSLEKARVDEALDPSKIPNISVVQSPSIAFKTTQDLKKILVGLAGGGIAVGLGFAFLIELLLNRSVKRPQELETLLGIPAMVSIPYLNGRNPLRLRWPKNRRSIVALGGNGHARSAPWESDHFIRPYSEAIRDRLVLYFQLNRLTHKPKLVAVTDCSDGAGASTLAGGLAAALSETGDGKVLLVDMNVGHPEVHPFFRGGPACSLAEALVGEPAAAGENLYLAVATPPDAPQTQLIPRKFYDLVPHLKASDFDYIIFDMPALGQTSITPAMAGLMDKVLVVVEAEKSIRDLVKARYQELLSCRANVSVILNKVRSYTPKGLGAGI